MFVYFRSLTMTVLRGRPQTNSLSLSKCRTGATPRPNVGTRWDSLMQNVIPSQIQKKLISPQLFSPQSLLKCPCLLQSGVNSACCHVCLLHFVLCTVYCLFLSCTEPSYHQHCCVALTESCILYGFIRINQYFIYLYAFIIHASFTGQL